MNQFVHRDSKVAMLKLYATPVINQFTFNSKDYLYLAI